MQKKSHNGKIAFDHQEGSGGVGATLTIKKWRAMPPPPLEDHGERKVEAKTSSAIVTEGKRWRLLAFLSDLGDFMVLAVP